MNGKETIEQAIHAADNKPAMVAFLTAGYPNKEQFVEDLIETTRHADVVEIGVPFSDPMADGVTIQQSSKVALEGGVNLKWIFETVARLGNELKAPVLFMSYLNPLMAFGFESLAKTAVDCGVSGFIVPDLPYEESHELAQVLEEHGLALVQLVTPVTPRERLAQLCGSSSGFVYAVTMTGITGSALGEKQSLVEYLDLVRDNADVPICAGFGISQAEDVARLQGHADGVIVGTALINAITDGQRPGAFLDSLRT